MKVGPELTLFWPKSTRFSDVNDAVLMLISGKLHKKSSEVCSTSASLSFKGQATKPTTVDFTVIDEIW